MAGVGWWQRRASLDRCSHGSCCCRWPSSMWSRAIMIALCSPYSRPFSEASFWISRAWKKVVVKVLVVQSCLTLCDPMDCSPPASSVDGILQARILEWVIPIFGIPFPVVIPFSWVSSWPRNWTQVSHIAGRFFTTWATRQVPELGSWLLVFEADTVCQTWAPIKQPWPLPSEGLSCLVTGTRKTATRCLDSVCSIKGKGMILFQLEYNQSQPLISVLAHNRVASCFLLGFYVTDGWSSFWTWGKCQYLESMIWKTKNMQKLRQLHSKIQHTPENTYYAP